MLLYHKESGGALFKAKKIVYPILEKTDKQKEAGSVFDGEYQEYEIYPGSSTAMAQLDALLEREGIRRDANLEYTIGLYDDGQLIATGSVFRNTLRCMAVDSRHQGEGLLNRVISRLISYQAQRGIFDLFVYTKCDTAKFFADLGFYEICRVPGQVVFMENRRGGFAGYLKSLGDGGPGESRAAVVMNANPFTLGHRYLVERAAAENDRVHLFVVSEDVSLVPFETRYRLVREGVAHLDNVTLHTTGPYMISSATFPSYFIKDSQDVIRAQARLDLQVFGGIAAQLGIRARYVGEEPFSQVTGIYNAVMAEELPRKGIRCVVLPRQEQGGSAISASAVRQLIQEGRMEEMKALVPESTYRYFVSPEGAETVRRIRESADVIHY